MSQTEIQHVVEVPSASGPKAAIAGTRIRVWDIHVWHDLLGHSAAEIVADFPQLTLADVYAALAYYHDHRQQLEERESAAERLISMLSEQQGPTSYTRLRDRLNDADQVSP